MNPLTLGPVEPDGGWCFFADPRALYFAGKRRSTYVGWLSAEGDVRVGRYDHALDQFESVLLHAGLHKDDHANPALYIDAEGRITVFYSAHNGPEMLYRTTERPEDLSSFGPEHSLPVNTGGGKGYTYPNPVYLRKERQLYLFWRGGNFKPNFSRCPDLGGNRWSEAETLILDHGHRPYIRFASDGEDTIHFACTDGHPNIEPTNSIYYACYRGGALYRADGARIKAAEELPLTLTEAETVFDGQAAGRNSWIWDIALDERGCPVIAYVVFAATNDHRYCCSRWSGEAWVHSELAAGGSWFPQTPEGETEREPYYSGGMILDHGDPSTVYVSRPVNGMFEIERWHTPDRGVTWSSEAVTSGSPSNQVRPFLTRRSAPSAASQTGAGAAGAPGQADPLLLFWMSGDYLHYTDYRTVLKAASVRA
ncbi:BNR repeat-containing family member [Paenibacillus sp. UNCCL117]|uniref:BNR-4 repeat-containing protein n=1 Tax=unclassified Paenibacillus TaxID=185978 RepID=UPI00088DCB00|nr:MULTISPECIES: BNR-4 repeat-containing protein [unclassified Paenibacillus]SDE40368.1 BNR repeat-containing family member [Paenibacillus sp. cl123]SFW65329.1 BNR repeat-containing family member [Paenibacillus sp. UNCCL117]